MLNFLTNLKNGKFGQMKIYFLPKMKNEKK